MQILATSSERNTSKVQCYEVEKHKKAHFTNNLEGLSG